MEIHHDKHHGTYVNNLNKALEGHADLQSKSIDDLLKNLDAIPENIRTAVRNNGGGHWNHSLFWPLMKKGGGGEPKGDLGSAINSSFGAFSGFQEKFAAAGAGRFGSGWVWLLARDGNWPSNRLLIKILRIHSQAAAKQYWRWMSGNMLLSEISKSAAGLHQGMVEHSDWEKSAELYDGAKK